MRAWVSEKEEEEGRMLEDKLKSKRDSARKYSLARPAPIDPNIVDAAVARMRDRIRREGGWERR